MQALLLDTHMVLWWVQDSPRINSQLRRTIESRLSYVSIVSLWEIAIKLSLGKVGLPIAMEDLLSTAASPAVDP